MQNFLAAKVLVPYDTEKTTRLCVDSSPIGTLATVTQADNLDNEAEWRPVKHTSRAWTEAEFGYGQIEREKDRERERAMEYSLE